MLGHEEENHGKKSRETLFDEISSKSSDSMKV